MHLVVNPRQVSDSRTLTDTTELVVDRSVTEAHPALIGTEIGHWNAAKMSANGRAADN